LYALVNETSKSIKHTAYPKAADKEPTIRYIKQKQKSGLYIFDVSRLINDQKVESYLLQKTVSGLKKKLEYSPFTERIAVL
jgi:hypothetical protein